MKKVRYGLISMAIGIMVCLYFYVLAGNVFSTAKYEPDIFIGHVIRVGLVVLLAAVLVAGTGYIILGLFEWRREKKEVRLGEPISVVKFLPHKCVGEIKKR